MSNRPGGEAAQVAPGAWRIPTPLPFPSPNSINVYAIEEYDGKVTLIDSTLGSPDAIAALAAGLAHFGAELSDIQRILVTHTHVDHYAGTTSLREYADFVALMHERCEVELSFYDPDSPYRHEVAELLLRHGMTEDELSTIGSPIDLPFSMGPADGHIEDGEKFEVGGRTLVAMLTPGHYSGHLCFYSDEDDVLFSGDHLMSKITPHVQYDGRFENTLADYLDALRKVEELDPRLALPAHFNILPDHEGAKRARQIAFHHERRLGAILQALKAEPRSAADLVDEIYRPNLLVFEKRLAMTETLAHLEYLRLDGRCEVIGDPDSGEILRYRRIR